MVKIIIVVKEKPPNKSSQTVKTDEFIYKKGEQVGGTRKIKRFIIRDNSSD